MEDAAGAATDAGALAESEEHRPKAEVSDADLQRAILAALTKHDNPRMGVSRRGRGALGSGLLNRKR